MFAKSIITTCLVLALSLSANAHMGLSPALGVKGTIVRSQVQRPSTGSPCGKVNIASTIDTSTAVKAAADGSFTATIHNFNAGADGSTFVTAKVDSTGKGTKFVNAVVTKNGIAAPKSVASSSIVAKLPAGTKCTGGKSGNLCVVSFVSKAGFGNCMIVQQPAAGGAKAAVATKAGASTAVAVDTGAKAAGSTGVKTECSAKSQARSEKKRVEKARQETVEDVAPASTEAVVEVADVDETVDETAVEAVDETVTEAKRMDARAVGSRAARALLREI